MVRGTKLENNKNISIKKTIKKIDPDDYIYIPLVTYNNKHCKCLVKEGSYVYKGDIIGVSEDKYSFPIHSTVSGFVKKIEEHLFIDNTLVNTVVIENDFKEREKIKKGVKRKINNYTVDEIVKLLKDCGVVGMSGSIFPTYYKYGMELKINTLLVNAVEAEPYMTSDYTLLNEKTPEILEAIDALMDIFNIKECVIALKNYNQSGLEDLIEYIGSYTNIRVVTVKDIYPIGFENSLIKYIFNYNIKVNPIEKGIVVNNISTIYEIYYALKYQKPLTERIITISGEGIKHPQNVIVKEGTLIKSVIDQIGGYKINNGCLVVNGPMIGRSLSTDKIMITKQVYGIVVLNNKLEVEKECINCGKCTNICPVRLSPIEIKNNLSNKKILKKLNPKKCIKCGLCSYICPSRIDLREIVNNVRDV